MSLNTCSLGIKTGSNFNYKKSKLTKIKHFVLLGLYLAEIWHPEVPTRHVSTEQSGWEQVVWCRTQGIKSWLHFNFEIMRYLLWRTIIKIKHITISKGTEQGPAHSWHSGRLTFRVKCYTTVKWHIWCVTHLGLAILTIWQIEFNFKSRQSLSVAQFKF